MYKLLLPVLCDWSMEIHLLTSMAEFVNIACMSVCICFALLLHKLFSTAFSELRSFGNSNHICLVYLSF